MARLEACIFEGPRRQQRALMFVCPHCGEEIEDDNAKSCPYCGSDDETGWREDVDYYAVDIPDWSEDDERPRRAGGNKLASKKMFLCVVALLAGLVMISLKGGDRPRTIFALMLIVGGGYGLLTHKKE